MGRRSLIYSALKNSKGLFCQAITRNHYEFMLDINTRRKPERHGQLGRYLQNGLQKMTTEPNCT